MLNPTCSNLNPKLFQEFRADFEGFPELMHHIEREGSYESFGYREQAKTIQKWWRHIKEANV